MDSLSDWAYGWTCAHPEWVKPVLYVLVPLVLHFFASVASASMKRFGVTDGGLVKVIRIAAIDAHPTDSNVVANAAVITASNPVLAVESGANPHAMARMADALKEQAKS